jgi:Tol biopolymer transport system component
MEITSSGRASGTGGVMYRKLASGAGEVETITQSDHPIFVSGWSNDGKFISYTDADPVTNFNLWVLPLEGDRKPFLYFQSSHEDSHGTFSPDGRFVAYRSSESSANEIYVQTFPASGGNGPSQPTAAKILCGRRGARNCSSSLRMAS